MDINCVNKIWENSERSSTILKNLGNKNKMLILCFLCRQEKSVSDIHKYCGLSQSQVSQYLGKMKLEGLVESNKRGKEVFYKISDNQVFEIIGSLKKIFN